MSAQKISSKTKKKDLLVSIKELVRDRGSHTVSSMAIPNAFILVRIHIRYYLPAGDEAKRGATYDVRPRAVPCRFPASARPESGSHRSCPKAWESDARLRKVREINGRWVRDVANGVNMRYDGLKSSRGT